jgi:hypothetical protein
LRRPNRDGAIYGWCAPGEQGPLRVEITHVSELVGADEEADGPPVPFVIFGARRSPTL